MTPELELAISRLHEVFGSYAMPPVVDMSPYRDPEKAIGAMKRKPLRELTAPDLDYYAAAALTTVGDEALFKYVLPRLLELVAEGELLTDSEIVLGKLTYGEWKVWRLEEQEAVTGFLRAWWLTTLNRMIWTFNTSAKTVLISIAQAERELIWYLDAWEKITEPSATDQLAEFIAFYGDDETGTLQPPPFLSEDTPQWWQIRSWLTRPQTLTRLRRGQVSASRRGFSDEYSAYLQAPQLLQTLLSGSET